MSEQHDDNAEPSLSLLAVCAFVLAILSFIFSLITGLPAIILGAWAVYRIKRSPSLYFGLGYAKSGIMLGLLGSAITVVIIAVFMPYMGRARELAGHSSGCSANLKGLIASMQAYAQANDECFPVGAPPVDLNQYSSMLNMTTGEKNLSGAQDFLSNRVMAGNVYAPLWMMVLTQQVSPKSFLCQSDPFADAVAARVTDKDGRYYATFQTPGQLSFSMAYPWYRNPNSGKIESAPWWKNTNDPTLPVMCDIAPMNATGKPRRDVATTLPVERAPLPYMGFNHDGAGMNVLYADGHVEWTTTPVVGQNKDNIFTSGGMPGFPPRVGEIEMIHTTTAPFDTVVVPVRDGKSGEIR